MSGQGESVQDSGVLDPLAFPLRGSRLIEASAGTGKTFTIAALYLRLVLGHGGEAGFGRPLVPPEILVVTFTDAATKELRDRIRARLSEAAAYFLIDPATLEESVSAGDLLHDLRGDYPPEQWLACARRLQLAAEWMDEAAVSTIHGWCNRMLREHAFDSGSLFTQTLETDQSELLAEVVRDYWRSFMVPLAADAVAEVLKWWSGPDALLETLQSLLAHERLLPAASSPEETLRGVLGERAVVLSRLKAPWAEWVGELQTLLDDAREVKAFNGTKLKKNNYDDWLERIATWRDDPTSLKPGLSDAAKARLSEPGLAEVWKSGSAPQHDALKALARLDEEIAGLPDARDALISHAVHWVTERFAAEQQGRAQMGFDDLLKRLDAALKGPNGQALAARIRQSFPVALIDEFQDTDPVQYGIFDSVYRIGMDDPQTALVLIGDPKQAIYSFRGADIHTYLVARRSCSGRLHTLKRNFRSTAQMVAATNRCFILAESRSEGDGAFLFRTEAANPVPFFEAEAAGRQDTLIVAGESPAALHACFMTVPGDAAVGATLSKEAYLAGMAARCATEMVRLLNLGQRGEAVFAGRDAQRGVRPADMAVLVNTRIEAAAIRQALAARGVRSVFLSERESVFQTPQALELLHWLAACAEPDNPRLLRAALATPALGLVWAELDTLSHDELAREARVLQFRDYRECWRRQGVLPMLRSMFNDFRLPDRLVGQAGGERVMTDLLHLAELLQHADGALEGEHALIRYLAEQRQERAGGAGGDMRQMRLESDADLVQVVTIHKSKGLEYPLVFIPFACSFRAVKGTDLPLKYHDREGRLRLALAGDAGEVAAADHERLGEDLRKLYVALTRARHFTWVGLAPLADLHKSAFGYLLGGGLPIAPDGLGAVLAQLAGGCAAIQAGEAAEPSDTQFVPLRREAPPGLARVPMRSVAEHWWVASYSSLRTTGGGHHLVAETPAEDVFREVLVDAPGVEQMGAPLAVRAGGGALHAFPRGAEVGTFLHELLEWAANQGFAVVVNNPKLLRDAIARRCNARGWTEWIDALTDWLTHFVQAEMPLPADGPGRARNFSLASLRTSMAEMEFWVEVHDADLAVVDGLVCQHTLDGVARPKLEPGQLNGMLKGFIDLVFEHEGRYYVADYKSNWLGPDDAAYTPAAMRGAILDARYELQYALYLFALHRLLSLRIPNYDYDRHIGGAVYLFLRGAHAPGGGVHHERPPRALIESLDRLFRARSARETA